MKTIRSIFIPCLLAFIGTLMSSCEKLGHSTQSPALVIEGCQQIPSEANFGSDAQKEIPAEEVITGLEVPWAIAFLPNGDWLVTERPGRVRRVSQGSLIDEPVLELAVGAQGEGGLLGIAVDPEFESNRFIYLYFTNSEENSNQVGRYRLSEDMNSAKLDRILIENIPAQSIHNGGRIAFGPDGKLYISTGDAGNPSNAQNRNSLAGKILRINSDGSIPEDNPFGAESPVYILGIRNVQGFDWVDRETLMITDHGPTGEFGRSGGDELNFARAGDNLGWPEIWLCEEREGMITPSLVWEEALPPGGAAFVQKSAVPEWNGSVLMGALGARLLMRVSVPDGKSEVHFRGDRPNGFGRLREVSVAPDGSILVTTSNCDGRGSCPEQRDVILRIRSDAGSGSE